MSLSIEQTKLLADIRQLVKKAETLVDQVQRVESHFTFCPPGDRDLTAIALAISEADLDLQIAIVQWMAVRVRSTAV